MGLQSYRELRVWQKAHQLVLAAYRHSRSFNSDERFGLTSQLRRAAVSIPANIAEGYGRQSVRDYLRMLYISQGSLEELKYYLLLSRDLGYVDEKAFEELGGLADEVGRLLFRLIESLKAKLVEDAPKAAFP